MILLPFFSGGSMALVGQLAILSVWSGMACWAAYRGIRRLLCDR